LNAIAKANRLDIELYRYAEDLFERQIQQYGITFTIQAKMFEISKRFEPIRQKLQTVFRLS
jgi:hypothetical protein